MHALRTGFYTPVLSLDAVCRAALETPLHRTRAIPRAESATSPTASSAPLTEPSAELCNAGQFTNRSGEQTTCNDRVPGRYQPGGQEACLDCPKGWYQDEGGRQFCLPCVQGEYNDETGEFNASSAQRHRIKHSEAWRRGCVRGLPGRILPVGKGKDVVPSVQGGQVQQQKCQQVCSDCPAAKYRAPGLDADKCYSCGDDLIPNGSKHLV